MRCGRLRNRPCPHSLFEGPLKHLVVQVMSALDAGARFDRNMVVWECHAHDAPALGYFLFSATRIFTRAAVPKGPQPTRNWRRTVEP